MKKIMSVSIFSVGLVLVTYAIARVSLGFAIAALGVVLMVLGGIAFAVHESHNG